MALSVGLFKLYLTDKRCASSRDCFKFECLAGCSSSSSSSSCCCSFLLLLLLPGFFVYIYYALHLRPTGWRCLLYFFVTFINGLQHMWHTHRYTRTHTLAQLWLQFVTVARIYKCGTWGTPSCRKDSCSLSFSVSFPFPFFMLPMFTRSTTFCWSSTNHQAFCFSPSPLLLLSLYSLYSWSSSYQPRRRPAVPFRYAYTAVFDLCVCVCVENVLTCVSLEFSSLFFSSFCFSCCLLLLLFSCCLVACVALLLFQSIDAF